MPLPASHLQRLSADLENHERRLSQLSESIALQEAERRVHETALNVGRDRKLQEALSEIYDDPDIARKIRSKAKDHFKEKGARIPDEADVRVTDDGADSTAIEAELKHGAYRYKLVWRRADGFALEALEGSRERAVENVRLSDTPGRKE